MPNCDRLDPSPAATARTARRVSQALPCWWTHPHIAADHLRLDNEPKSSDEGRHVIKPSGEAPAPVSKRAQVLAFDPTGRRGVSKDR
jgi:hypothetical protein